MVKGDYVITLTTDFGLMDPFVGIMKGVILGICPGARIVDLTHEIPPGDIRKAAFCLAMSAPYFPAGTVHAAVVDPGVGSERRGIAVECERSIYVGPDNGIFSLAFRGDRLRRAVKLENAKFWLPEVSQTFHGRDIFAPVAAHLAAGVSLDRLGPEIDNLKTIDFPEPKILADGKIEGQVIHVDHFGNCITNLPGKLMEGRPRTTFRIGGGRVDGVGQSYSDVRPGQLVAVVGSSGFVEIAVRDGNAAERLGAYPGMEVLVL